jgi:serine/threonine protein kinase/WD40 repeat protein
MNAALAGTMAGDAPGEPADADPQPTGRGGRDQGTGGGRPAASVHYPPRTAAGAGPGVGAIDEFKRGVLELGVMDDQEFERMAARFPAGGAALTRALVQSGTLTAYQASALAQGKGRGLVIKNYLILDKLGAGGMGVVFKARHRVLGRIVALKMLPPSLARDPNLVLRFRREVQLVGCLNHPNIVSALDADEDRGVHYLTMEYIEGRDLDRVVQEGGALPISQAVDCVIQVARGLEAAHAQGIVHRDIKPANLMLDRSRTVRVLDLGLARLAAASGPFGEAAGAGLTRSGVYMGTVDYAAPEQAQDSSTVDHRADIYSLGCSLYYLLTGRAPFEGATMVQRVMAHLNEPAPPLRAVRSDVPAQLEAAYLAMMAKQPDDRPSSMTQVVALLEPCRTPAGGRSERRAEPEPLIETDAHGSAPAEPTTVAPGSSAGGRLPALEPIVVDATAAAPALAAPLLDHRQSPRSSWSALRRPAVLAAAAGLLAVAALAAVLALSRPHAAPESLPTESTSRTSSAIHQDSAPAPVVAAPDATTVSEAMPIADGAAKSPGAAGGEPPNQSSPVETVRIPDPPKASPELALRVTKATPDRAMPDPAPALTYDMKLAFRGHTADVRALAVTRDGRRALSAGYDHTARLWDVATGAEIRRLAHPSEVFDAAMTPDGIWALTGTKGRGNLSGVVRLWDLRTGRERPRLPEAHKGEVSAVAILPLPDGRGLSGGHDGRVVLWNLVTGKEVATVGLQKGLVRSRALAFFNRNRWVISAGADPFVHVWDLASGTEKARWDGHMGTISSIDISADRSRAVTGSFDGTVILWDTATGSPLRRLPMPERDLDIRAAILPDGNIVAAGGRVGHLVVWDSSTGAILRQAEKPLFKHGSLAVLPDGRRVLAGDADGMVRLWTPRTR